MDKSSINKNDIFKIPQKYKFLEEQLMLFQKGLDDVFTQLFLVNLEKDEVINNFSTHSLNDTDHKSYSETYEMLKNHFHFDVDLDVYFSYENLKAHFNYSKDPINVNVKTNDEKDVHFFQIIVTPLLNKKHERNALFFVRNRDSESELESFKKQMKIEHERNMTRRKLIEENYITAAEVDVVSWKVNFLLRPIMDLDVTVDCDIAIEKYIELFADKSEEEEIRKFFSRETAIRFVREFDEYTAVFKRITNNGKDVRYSKWKITKQGAAPNLVLVREFDVTELKMAERAQFMATQYQKALTSDAIIVYNANISRDLLEEELFECVNGKKIPVLPLFDLSVPCKFSEWIKKRSLMVAVQDRQNFLDSMDTQKIIEGYKHGIREIKSEFETMDAAGNKIFVDHTTLLAQSPQEGEIIAINIVKDITERHNKEIEQKLALQNAAQKAEEANNAKTQFLSNVSHDIRTPMNAIRGLTSLALDEIDNIDNKEQIKEYLTKIEMATNHLLALINNVLDINHIESNKIVLNHEKFSMRDLLSRISPIILPQIQNEQQIFHFKSKNICHEYFIGDLLHINLVLINILGNSMKFTPKGGSINFSIEEKETKLGKTEIVFTISDTGQGMSKSFLKKIYDPFERETQSGKKHIEGSGLGLSITKKLVDLMGGKIEVESEIGEGTTFTITLMLDTDEEPDYLAQDLQALKAKKMLFISEDKNFKDEELYPLTNTGVKFDVAKSASETEKKISASAYNLVFVSEDNLFKAKATVSEIIKKSPSADVYIISPLNSLKEKGRFEIPQAKGFIPSPLLLSSILLEVIKTNKNSRRKLDDIVPRFPGKRVLLVEDNELNMIVSKAFISKMEVILDTATNGEQALEKFEKSEKTGSRYDLIFMDIQMPVLNGYETVQKIRAKDSDYAQTVPVIGMSANTFVEDQNNAFKAGMTDYIIKPIEVQTIYDKAKKYLAEQTTEDAINKLKSLTAEMHKKSSAKLKMDEKDEASAENAENAGKKSKKSAKAKKEKKITASTEKNQTEKK